MQWRGVTEGKGKRRDGKAEREGTGREGKEGH